MTSTNDIKSAIIKLKKERNACILAHTYQSPEIQDVADYVGDSYGLSVEASQTSADCIIFCGVLFMAETAAILNPLRTVILPHPQAGCPMADMITAPDLKALKKEYPNANVVCYVNSPAEVKALSDVCVTSSNAVTIVNKLPTDRPIIFVPDKHLGSYVMQQTGRDMILWDGFCPTHLRINEAMIVKARNEHPNAQLLMHPEAPKAMRQLADAILSTGQMCTFVKSSKADEFIIATEIGLLHTLKTQTPSKKYYALSDQISCPNMKKTTIEMVYGALAGSGGKIVTVEPAIAALAKKSLTAMLSMS
jgi:quinolinate synthase